MGRVLTAHALERGHHVTLFHRGQTGAGLFAQCEHLHGDRDGGLQALAGRQWDAVVDTSGYLPRVVRASVDQLRDSVAHYVFISSISVYAEPTAAGSDERAPLRSLPDPSVESITGETYGGLKALCEGVVRTSFDDRALIVRPGLIVGPHDPTERFTWWPERLARGGRVIAPGDPEQGVQFIDARDLGEWLVRSLEQRVTGTLHAIGPQQTLSMRRFLETARDAVGGGAELVWMDEKFLLANDVGPWMEIPLWVTSADAGLAALDVSRAVAAGLTFRSVADTITACVKCRIIESINRLFAESH